MKLNNCQATTVKTNELVLIQDATFVPSTEGSSIAWSPATSWNGGTGATYLLNSQGLGNAGGYRFYNGKDGSIPGAAVGAIAASNLLAFIQDETTYAAPVGNAAPVINGGGPHLYLCGQGSATASTFVATGTTPKVVTDSRITPFSVILFNPVPGSATGFASGTAASLTAITYTGPGAANNTFTITCAGANTSTYSYIIIN